MFDLTSNTTLMTCLACVALHPGLRSILVLDAPPMGLQQLADLLAAMLRASTNLPVRHYQLGSFEADDDIWGGLNLPGYHAGTRKLPAHRLFSAERNAQELQLISLPDLAVVSLMAARSLTMLIGADVVHLERNGISSRWRPQQCWLASCRADDIGKLSPHLLDRFAVRLSWPELVPPDATNAAITPADLLAHVPREAVPQMSTLPPAYLQLIEQAIQHRVEVSQSALARVLEYVPSESYYPRREIALARLAQTLAQLSGAQTLQRDHVDRAACMLGLIRRHEPLERVEEPEEALPPGDDDAEEEPGRSAAKEAASSAAELLQEIMQPRIAQLPETVYTGMVESGRVCSNPYPEDEAPIEREEAALKLPLTRYALSRSAHGTVIGVEESDTLYDLALVGTILAAARFQKVRQEQYRCQHKHDAPGLLFERMDLRRYRRSRPIEQVFVLLFDYTSIRENDQWEEALIPYLHAAYTARAGITIIKVGAADALAPLRAEVVNAKNILVPRVGLALEVGRGQATPLAHGLSLALEQLQRTLQHGRSTAQKVTLVALSDGRGNVPLLASLRGGPGQIITREGIDDALREARKVRALKHVEAIVLNPQPIYYPDLPERLAEALGATLLPIPRHEKVEEV